MKKMFIGFFVFLLLGKKDAQAISRTEEIANQERLRLVHADSLVSVSKEGQELWELWGHVQLVQGEARLSCVQARWWLKDDEILLRGEVEIYDGKRTLRGDQVHYDGKTKEETATGHVSLESNNRKLTAQRIQYAQEEEVASAFGNVFIRDFIEKATIQGAKAVYNRSLDYSFIEGLPQLVKVDTASGERMVVNGVKMEAWGQEQRVVVTDSVRIEKGDLKGSCQKAEYRSRENVLVLEKMPVVWQRGQRMQGDRIDIRLEGVRFQGGFIQGKAEIVSTDSTLEDVLKGQQILVEARDDTIRKVIVEGQASSLYHVVDEDDLDQGVNSVTGDRIILTFDGDRLDQVKVESSPGQCTGVYTPKKLEKVLRPEEKDL